MKDGFIKYVERSIIYLSRKEGNERIETSLCMLGHVLRCHICSLSSVQFCQSDSMSSEPVCEVSKKLLDLEKDQL
jgi:hypothetical protein